MAVKLARSIWLFDCGEDTQRQMHRQPLIRHGKVDRIFITNCRSSNILGLPGQQSSPVMEICCAWSAGNSTQCLHSGCGSCRHVVYNERCAGDWARHC